MVKNKNLAICALLLACGALAAICINQGKELREARSMMPIIGDTITITDTIHDSVPYPVKETIVKYKELPVICYINNDTDTIEVHDTIVLPITQKYYAAKEYEAWVSGYDPSLDSINVFARTQYIPVIQRELYKPKVAVVGGVTTGLMWGGKMSVGVGVTIGVPLWEW